MLIRSMPCITRSSEAAQLHTQQPALQTCRRRPVGRRHSLAHARAPLHGHAVAVLSHPHGAHAAQVNGKCACRNRFAWWHSMGRLGWLDVGWPARYIHMPVSTFPKQRPRGFTEPERKALPTHPLAQPRTFVAMAAAARVHRRLEFGSALHCCRHSLGVVRVGNGGGPPSEQLAKGLQQGRVVQGEKPTCGQAS